MTNQIVFHLPVRPYSPIDAHNRAAAAHGSPRIASLTAYANYNGHHVDLRYNDYRGYYVAEYFWAGRVVLARGSFQNCLNAVLNEYHRGALGASATITPRADDTEALELVRATPEILEGSPWVSTSPGYHTPCGNWYTWKHEVGAESARDMANPGSLKIIFDWSLLQDATDRNSYEAALRAKHGRIYV
jgi:hypothetical protein